MTKKERSLTKKIHASPAKEESSPNDESSTPTNPSSSEYSSQEIRTSGIKLTPQTVIEASLGLKGIDVDDEIILVDLLADYYFRLNSTATFIWQLVLQTITLEEISQQLSQKFHLPSDKASEVVSGFVDELIKKGLVVPSTVTES